MCLIAYFRRWYLPAAEDLSRRISPAALARNSPRFAVLTGVMQPVQVLERMIVEMVVV